MIINEENINDKIKKVELNLKGMEKKVEEILLNIKQLLFVLPTPNGGEDKDQFINRCMANDKMNNEYPDEDQRYAVCQKQWEKK